MSDDTVPLREYLEMLVRHQQELRQEDRQISLQMMGDWSKWREDMAIEMAGVKARIATIAAVFMALLAVIQLWRGTP